MYKPCSALLCVLLASEVFAQSRPPASPNSFQAVTSHLDPGGDLFLYVNPEDWLKGLSSQINQWRNLATAAPNSNPTDRLNVARFFDAVTSVVKNSGIEDVGGFGMSSIAREKGLYRSTYLLYHARGKDSGYMWSVFGKKPHPFDALALLPANTVFASFSDIDLPLVWSILDKEIGQSGIPGAREALQRLPSQFSATTGMSLDTALNSLGGTYGIVLSIDESKMSVPPTSGGPMPDFAIMLVLKVKNEAIFKFLESTLTHNSGGIRRDQPSFAQSGDYLLLSSSENLIQQALSAKSGAAPGLRSRDEFKKLAQDVPVQGNSFVFMSQKASETIARLLQTRMGAGSTAGLGVQAQIVTSLFGASSAFGAYRVAANTDEGWISVGNGGQNPANIALLPFTVAPLLAASVAAPNLMRSGVAANESSAVANLKTIAAAEMKYATTSGGRYGVMPALIRGGLLDSRLASAINGYQFAILISGESYTATATPVSTDTGRYGYFVTSDGVIRYSSVPALAPAGEAGRPVH